MKEKQNYCWQMARQAKRGVSRRQLLTAGCVGALGLSLPNLLLAEDFNAGEGFTTRAKSCIFIHQYGGLSQLDSWDPKPDAPQEIRGPYQPIATATPGFHVSELMPRLAALSNEYAVIRSMRHEDADHVRANSRLLAGRVDIAPDSPSFGSMITRLRPSAGDLPSYVWLQKFGGGAAPPEATYVTGGKLGMAYAPLVIGEGHNDNPASADFRIPAFDLHDEVPLARLRERTQLVHQLGNASGRTLGSAAAAANELYLQRSLELISGDKAREAFDVNRENSPTRDRYGRNPLGQNLLMARRLVEAGVRLVNVVAWTGLAPDEKFLSVETWDMHGNADVGIFEDGWNGLPFALPRADQAVATLLEDLKERGLLETTLVVLIGEFGRAPVISKGAKKVGRNHWPQCYSAMLAGAGITGGAVYGESDKHAAQVKTNPVSLEDFTATLFQAMDIPPASRLSPDGFTQPASTGQPLAALL
jgi:hypothetical protein